MTARGQGLRLIGLSVVLSLLLTGAFVIVYTGQMRAELEQSQCPSLLIQAAPEPAPETERGLALQRSAARQAEAYRCEETK